MSEDRLLPADFLFGVSDSGYQSEGGFNGPGEPQNNWAGWERTGRVEPAGIANEFWTRYDEHFERAAAVGCGAYRLSVEWARCEPSPGLIDRAALDHYAEILRSCRRHGLEPVVALHHFTQPAWLDDDLWLDPTSPERFAQWARAAAAPLAEECSRWITLNEINANAIGSRLVGYFPPGQRFRPTAFARTIDHMLAAHVAAYDEIHAVRPDAQVGTSTFAFWAYDVDTLLIDVLRSRAAGIGRAELGDWLAERRRQHQATLFAHEPAATAAPQSGIHEALRRYVRLDTRLHRALDAVERSPHERTLDVVQVNYYDPKLSNYLRIPGRSGDTGRSWQPDPEHWEQRPHPAGLTAYLQAVHEPGMPVWILENGLCNASVDDRGVARRDGWDRATYLRRHLAAITDAVATGVDVRMYCWWALFDNYQWGEFTSRFGLHAVDRSSGTCVFSDRDSVGHDAGGALWALATGLLAGDRSVLAEPAVRADPGELRSGVPRAGVPGPPDPDAPVIEAAFFDLDKTVIAKPAMVAFARPLVEAGLLSRRLLVRSAWSNAVFTHVGASDRRLHKLRATAMRITHGWHQGQIRDLVEQRAPDRIAPLVFADAAELIEEHRRAGRRTYLVSASPLEIVEPIAALLGIDECIASVVELDDDGRYTGEVAFWSYGPHKADAIHRAAERHNIDLARSYAYSDSATDLPMLSTVGHPVAVNPDRALVAEAKARGWPVARFERRVHSLTGG